MTSDPNDEPSRRRSDSQQSDGGGTTPGAAAAIASPSSSPLTTASARTNASSCNDVSRGGGPTSQHNSPSISSLRSGSNKSAHQHHRSMSFSSVTRFSGIGLTTPRQSPLLGPQKGHTLAYETTPRQHNNSTLEGRGLPGLTRNSTMSNTETKSMKSELGRNVANSHQHNHRVVMPDMSHVQLPSPKSPHKCPLFCCFYAEFDNKVGPKVCFQSPRNFMEQNMSLALEQVHAMLDETFANVAEKEQQKRKVEAMTTITTSQSSIPPPPPPESPPPASAKDYEPSKLGMDANNTSFSEYYDDDADDEVAAFDRGASTLTNSNIGSIFDSCSEYIITGHELTNRVINLSTHHIHILTRPTLLHDVRYERNSLLFCVGFVLRRTEDPRPFRPVLSKWAMALSNLETESNFLSNALTRPKLQVLLEQILVSLNSSLMECNLILSPSQTLHLKLFHPPKRPAAPVPDYAVPVLLRRDWQVQAFDWDLTINWVLLHIDGIISATQIGRRAEVDMEMVRACLRVLSHHGVIALVDLFFFTNVYEATATSSQLTRDTKLWWAAAEFCLHRKEETQGMSPTVSFENAPVASPMRAQPQAHVTAYDKHEASLFRTQSMASNSTTSGGGEPHSGPLPAFATRPFLSQEGREKLYDVRLAVADLYARCHRRQSLRDMWLELLTQRPLRRNGRSISWKRLFHLIDHRRFVTFGLVHNLIRRVHCFPILVRPTNTNVPHSLSHHLSQRESGNVQLTYRPEYSRHVVASPKPSPTGMKHRLANMMDGAHCDDELVSEAEFPFAQILQLFENEHVVKTYATLQLD